MQAEEKKVRGYYLLEWAFLAANTTAQKVIATATRTKMTVEALNSGTDGVEVEDAVAVSEAETFGFEPEEVMEVSETT